MGEILNKERRDLLQIYFNEVAETPLLSREEEKELFRYFLKWKKERKEKKSKCGGWSKKKGKEAKEKLIKANLRLVIKIANDYKDCGLELPDLISEGNLGLITAIDKYNPDKGTRLSTYACLWIKQFVMRALSNQSRLIRIPVPTLEQKRKITNFINSFNDKYNREPTFEEIRKKFKFTEKKLNLLFESGLTPKSLDEPAGDDSKETFETRLEDFSTNNPSTIFKINDDSNMIERILLKLNRRERFIIIRRFGLRNYSKETLEKIGQRYGVTRERIRQIEAIALKKLRFYTAKEIEIKL